uniref:RNA-directed RNA polymerase L n=1 Tax=Apple rubbery wood virus 1 TaxID=2164102 RepID=A0A2S1B5E3_9VIRU|nr:RNA-dependent RNA polymerase [Apple rubbery wood virus 1]
MFKIFLLLLFLVHLSCSNINMELPKTINTSIEGYYVSSFVPIESYSRTGNFVRLMNNKFVSELVKIDYNNPNFIHDGVCFAIFGKFGTDIRYKTMTPDFLGDNFILEITTSSSSFEDVLKSKLEEKISKYEAIRQTKKLVVIVVSYDMITSNYEIDERLQAALISNYINLKKLQSELLTEGKSYWVNTQESSLKRRLSNILKNYVQKANFDQGKKAFELIDDVWDKFNYSESVKSVFEEVSSQVSMDIVSPSYLEKKQNDVFPPQKGKKNMKRITVVPMICPSVRKSSRMIRENDLDKLVCKSKCKLINSSSETQTTQDEFASKMTIFEVISGYYEEKSKDKKEKKGYQFKPELTSEELLELNLDGIMAKEARDIAEVKQKRLESKEPFSYDVNVSDIEEFRKGFPSLLVEEMDEVPKDECYPLMKMAHNCIIDANVNLMDQGELLVKEFNSENRLKLFNWLNFVSDLMFEINLSLRENTKDGYFIVKCLKRYDADVYIKTTNSSSHIFFFVVCKLEYSLSETIGPKFVRKDGIVVTEWGSMLKRDLENFLNIKETVRSTFVCYDEIFESHHEEAKLNAKWLSLMILLNNKDRNEEIITSLRYTYMKSLSITEHSSTMNKKLNLLFRDRLQVYLTRKVLELNNCLSVSKPKITFHLGQIEIQGLKDPFERELTFKEAINLSYAGYIMTKVKQPQSNQASKMIEKILEYEIKYLEVKPEEISINKIFSPKPHCFDYEFVRVFCEMSKELLKQSYGNQLDKIIEDKVAANLSSINFESISTLKASAKLNINGKFSEENLKQLKSSRPRVLTNIMHLIETHEPVHYIDLIEPCIAHIIENDSFNVELFPKDQHNGLREIYVVDIHVRIVQLFLETISRSLCSMFQSETLNHPRNSTGMIPKVLKLSLEKNENPFCLMKSGDASKWSQSQIVTKFYIVLKCFLPIQYHKIIKDSLSLWFDKKIFLPPALIESFMNTNFQTTNEILNNLREGEYKMIKEKDDMFMRVNSGFMQGILHHSSSLFHTIVQEGFRQFQFKFLHESFVLTKHELSLKNLYISILQGSDDSSMSIMGDAKLFKQNKGLFLSLMHLKDSMSYKFGIIPSSEKTATCVPFIIEYNSQWLALGKSIQPTIKFAMVSCQLPAAQSIIQRQEFYYNLLKDCLEKGCSTRTCFMIKLSQLSSHYNLLGCNNTSSFNLTSTLLQDCLNPSLGFFILEPAIATAVFGFDFSFYCHTQGSLIKFLPDSLSSPHESNLPSGNTLRVNAHVSKSSWKKWKDLVESVGTITDTEQNFLDNNALIYYQNSCDTYSSKLKIKQKIQDFDVKQSLSSRYGITENMAAFFCTFMKVCKVGKDKDSLIGWMLKCTEDKISNLSHMFPKCALYNEIIHYISQLSYQSYLVDADYVQRGRNQVTVLHNKTSEHEMLCDTIKYVWFDLDIDEVTKNAYRKLFNEYKAEFDWLKDTEKETREHMKCSSRQLANYIRNVVGKNRTLTFYDTVAKGANYPYLLTRIFQKGKKVQVVKRKEQPSSIDNDLIFSNLKVLLNLPYTDNFKTSTVKSLVSKINKNELTSKEAKKFKILKLLLEEQLEDLESEFFKYSFDSHLSWYSQVQHFNHKTKEWEGLGCLTTVIAFLVIKTHILDDKIIKISINDLSSFRDNLSTYFKIVKDQKLSYNNDVGDDLKLSKLGLSKDIKGTKIEIIPELKVNLSSLRNSKLAYSNGNMKIVAPMFSEDNKDFFRGKLCNLQTLYQIEITTKASNFQDMRNADHKGMIEKKIWVDSLNYKSVRDGPVLGIRHQIGGRDVKVSTIMNFEIWKKITLSTSENLFEWGELGTMIVNQEPIIIENFVTKKLNDLPPQLPIENMFNYYMEENNFDKEKFLSFMSKVEFFHTITDPEYDETVKKDMVEEEQENLLEALNNLIFNSNKLQSAIIKTIEFDTCLTNLESTLLEASADFNYSRFIIYGIKDTQTTFPSSLLYKFNHELKRQVPDDDELLEIMSKGDVNNLLTVYQKICLKLLFDTPLVMPSINTLRKLREYVLLGYTPKSSRSSRSSSRLGLYVPDDDFESQLIKKFKMSPKMADFEFILREEMKEIKEAIEEISKMVDKTSNRRVKMPLITQLSELIEGLTLLQHFERNLPKNDDVKIISSDSSSNEMVNYSSSEDQDEMSQASSLSTDGNDDFNLFELLMNSYNHVELPKQKLPQYVKLNLVEYFSNGFSNVENLLKNCEYTFHYNGIAVVENGSCGVEIWWEDAKEDFIIFSHKKVAEIPFMEKLINKQILPISSYPEGSCLFNSVKHLIKKNKGLEFTQEELRKIVFTSTFQIELDVSDHRKDIMSNSVWGQEEDISTLCHELNISIGVVTDYSFLLYNEEADYVGAIINYNNTHFDVIE